MPRGKGRKAALVAGVTVIVLVGIAFAVYRAWLGARDSVSYDAEFDVGKVVQGEQVEHTFAVRNESPNDLAVQRVLTSYATMATFDSILPAGSEWRVKLSIDTRNLKGALNEFAKVELRDAERSPFVLRLRGRVAPPVELDPRDRVYFFTVTGEAPREEVFLINHLDRPLEIVDVTCSNPAFVVETEVVEQGREYKLTVALTPATPVGRHRGTITVTTDSPDYPSLDIQLRAFVEDIVSTSVQRVDFARIPFDALDRKTVSEKTVLVKKHRGEDFQVTAATADVPFLSVKVAADEPGQSYLIYVTIERDRAERGEFEGTLLIETNDSDFPRLELPIAGIIL
ncbi:MAG: DUF1573 domain-containing protein [Gemmatimonadales bacterium]|nr:DUF1573 domain-containing protein [Gemmatimonadales bacterium]NIN48506.1 DUF1573 domain-containing protein [Gemmatimonadales bacterium]NIP05970.1 DUF1573 domain-containing protein [Gemmatimonadales bacterium]NIQ99922.1 DUF1573 domain-containing protein [Gemmatimonadales bacterium]NIS64381.1 DUF1573 domain-containing protein [Gemmatimonadales bacterium]